MTRREVLKRVVRIKDVNKHTKVLGTGMLVTRQHVLTCTHVLQEALRAPDDLDLTGESVPLDFPSAKNIITQYAKVIRYYPAHASSDGLHDMALLLLKQPSLLNPLNLNWSEPKHNIPVKVLGFPSGAEDDGRWRNGELSDPTARGWYYVTCTHNERSFLKGFSGGPVF